MPGIAPVDLARIQEKHRGIPVRYIDEVATPNDDGAYVTVMLMLEGHPVEALVFTTENFYDALSTVIRGTMPGSAGIPLS